MTVTKGPPRRNSSSRGGGGGDRGGDRGGGGGGGGGGNWQRGNEAPSGGGGSNRRGSGGDWQRGQAPPKNQNRGGGGGRGGNQRRGGQQQPPFYDGPVEKLVRSANHWMPRKNSSAMVVAEKKVKSILNKMTKEKFATLSVQMLEIPIISYETLSMMIDNIYDKAIDEPSFGDMYADLCVSLSQSVQVNKLVHIIESDEEPPTEDGQAASPNAGNQSSSSHHTVYRWSNDVTTSDEQIVGPLASPEECVEAAHAAEEEARTPVERGDMTLELVSVSIKRGIFIKIMKKKDAKDGDAAYYVVYFPVGDAEEVGQQLSDIFLSQMECESDAAKKNSFKRSLLNKCEEEFNKQDIYVDWKAEKKAYEETKSSLAESARAEKEEELDFRRIRIKKQMLGNVKFIGQLYKKRLLKEKIMRYCMASLLKLEELPKGQVKSKNPEYKDSGETDMDEEDHEAICNMFMTIGSTIDSPAAAMFMDVCFTKIRNLSVDKILPMRSRFMYKDLLELRGNNWVPRRKVEKAKTLEEIRKDVELEERRQAHQSQQGRGGGYGSRGGRGGGDYRSGRSSMTSGSNRPRQPRQSTETDEDGFTTIVGGSRAGVQRGQSSGRSHQQSRTPPAAPKQAFAALADEQAPSKPKVQELSEEKLEKCIKSMRSDFLTDGGNLDELFLSMDEISGTPDAGSRLVMTNAERMMEAKKDERKAIYRIISILVEKGRLTKEDVQKGLEAPIEFIDDVVMDSPRAYEYIGDLLGDMLRLKAIDMPWLCEQLAKTKTDNPNTQAPEKVVRFSLNALKASGGSKAVSGASDDESLSRLLGAENWKAISQELG